MRKYELFIGLALGLVIGGLGAAIAAYIAADNAPVSTCNESGKTPCFWDSGEGDGEGMSFFIDQHGNVYMTVEQLYPTGE